MTRPLLLLLFLCLIACETKVPATHNNTPAAAVIPADTLAEADDEKQDSTVIRIYFDTGDDTFSLRNSISITPEQFNAYVQAYQSGLDTSERQIRRTHHDITLPTASRAISFQADTTDYRSYV